MRPKKASAFKNRFQKFYHLHKEDINKTRRKSYKKKKQAGVCVRCHKKSLKGITFCSYHRYKQKEYNKRRG